MRNAEEILRDADAGHLDLPDVKVRETARLTIVDKETGEVTERTVTTERHLTRDENGRLTIS